MTTNFGTFISRVNQIPLTTQRPPYSYTMEDTIKQLRDADAKEGKPGIYEGWGHTGQNYSSGVHREYALELSNRGLPFNETFKEAKLYVDMNDDIISLTFSTNLDALSKFGKGGELWFHKKKLLDKINRCKFQIMYIK